MVSEALRFILSAVSCFFMKQRYQSIAVEDSGFYYTPARMKAGIACNVWKGCRATIDLLHLF
jgi:hypothetical protein